jgi:hypothetical protein
MMSNQVVPYENDNAKDNCLSDLIDVNLKIKRFLEEFGL